MERMSEQRQTSQSSSEVLRQVVVFEFEMHIPHLGTIAKTGEDTSGLVDLLLSESRLSSMKRI